MDLKELLGEELYNQLMEKAGDKHKVALVSDGNWIPKDKFNEINEAKKQLEGDIKDRDKQLNTLKDSVKDNDTLKEQINQLQNENKSKDTEYQTKLKDMAVNTAIKLALAGEAHDPDLVVGLLEKSKIEINGDGTVKAGLDDQIKGLRESKSFLFAEKQEEKSTFKGFRPADGKDKKDGGTSSLGESFAKAANDSGKAPAAAPNFWG